MTDKAPTTDIVERLAFLAAHVADDGTLQDAIGQIKSLQARIDELELARDGMLEATDILIKRIDELEGLLKVAATQALMFTDDAGTDYDLTAAGADVANFAMMIADHQRKKRK